MQAPALHGEGPNVIALVALVYGWLCKEGVFPSREFFTSAGDGGDFFDLLIRLKANLCQCFFPPPTSLYNHAKYFQAGSKNVSPLSSLPLLHISPRTDSDSFKWSILWECFVSLLCKRAWQCLIIRKKLIQ